MDVSYIINHLGEERENYFNAISPPIIQSSNFAFENIEMMRKGLAHEREISCYTRGMNPTVDILKKKVAALEGAEDALIVSSGCAAISSAVISCIKSGEHIVCVNNPYGWTNKLMTSFLPNFGISSTLIDGTSPENFKKAIKSNTRVFYLESPNSYTFELQDIVAVSKIARENNIITIIDNSYSTSLFQKPLALGADIVVYSASKYFGGHSDLVAGIICSSKERIDKIFKNEFMTLGNNISPNDAWLILRGLRTLPLRMEKISESTAKVVQYLKTHPKVEKIFYPFDENFEQYSLAKKQMKKCAGLFTIKLKVENLEKAENFCNSLKRFLLACSWGGHESLIFPSCIYFNSNLKSTLANLSFDLVRFYVGLEEPEVLIEDLADALSGL